MADVPKYLMFSSAIIVLLLGSLHLIYTFFGPKFRPRDAKLEESMRLVSPVISRETTMWRAWVGFNASHSFGAMLFGLIYGYLALAHSTLLLGSGFLLAVGLVLLIGYTLLAKAYWFSIPFRGISLSLALYIGSIAASFV